MVYLAVGLRIGRWTLMEDAQNCCARPQCQCDCGAIKNVLASNLKNGSSKSCGCLMSELVSARNTTHGKTGTRLFSIWTDMRSRCRNRAHQSARNYSLKGITVCHEWDSDFIEFEKWALSNGYADNLSIDRRDVNKGYTPENCRWITMFEQQGNKRTNVIIDGMTQAEWCRKNGVPKAAAQRLRIEGKIGA